MSRNIFQGNSSTNNIFTNNPSSQSQTNIFTRNQQNSSSSNNIFNSQNNTNSNSNNIFNSQTNTQSNAQGNNIFNQNQNQNQQGNIFNRGNNTQGNNLFNNNQGGNNIFNNNQGNNQNSMFNNQNNQGNNIFNNNSNQNNIFSQNNRQNNNIFTQNSQQGQNFYNNQGGIPQSFFNQPLHFFHQFSPEQQAQLIHNMKNDEIKRFIQYCMRTLIDPSNPHRMYLSEQNLFRHEKVNKLAAKLNIKNEMLYIKKQVKEKIVTPIANLKMKNEVIIKKQKQLANKLSQKLLSLKQQLVESTTQNKMIQNLREEVEQIDNQVKEFIKPLFNSCEGRNSYTFIDPDPFCIKISERILKNITVLDNKMDEMLACESQAPQEVINISDTIEHLIQYYENVALSLKQFAERFNKIKREALSKRYGKIDGRLDHIKKKSMDKLQKQLKAYTLLKQIEKILQQRCKQKKIT